jgi:Fe2+ transport system protein FeoA
MGESGLISEFSDPQIACRILTMGMLPNSKVTLIRKGLFSETFYIKLDGQRMALRKNEAANIELH